MNNYLDVAIDVYRSIPYITPALKTNLEGNYECEIDFRIANNREKFFTGGALAALAVFQFSSITVLTGFATPFAIVGIVALGVLGCAVDQKLTYRAANNLAIERYLKSDDDKALDWLLGDMSRINLLLKNVDLKEKDDFVRTLMEKDGFKLNERCGGLRGFSNLLFRAGRDADSELFNLFWNQCDDSDKIRNFTTLLGLVCQSEKDSCKKNVDYLIDNKMIYPEMFTDQQQFNLMNYCLRDFNTTDSSLQYLEKLNDLGFSIDAKNDKGQSIRDHISYFIFKFALDYSSFRMVNIEVGQEKSVLRVINFLQDYEKKKSGLLVEKRVLEIEEVWTEDKLEKISPYLTNAFTGNLDMFQQASKDNNEKIGSILWNKTDVEERKKAFWVNLFHKNPKLAICLMKGAHVTSKMFTEDEQFRLFDARFIGGIGRNYVNPECVDLLINLGFNIRAKHQDGRTVREVLINEIATKISYGNISESDHLNKSLEVVDDILKKQNIATAVVLKQGQASGESNLSVFPDDVLNHIAQTMVATH